jgi:hypothetical protein
MPGPRVWDREGEPVQRIDETLASRSAFRLCCVLGAALAVPYAAALHSGPGILVALLAGLWVSSALLTFRALWMLVRLPERRRPLMVIPLVMFGALSLLREGLISGPTFDVTCQSSNRAVRSDSIVTRNGPPADPKLSDLSLNLEPVEGDGHCPKIVSGFQQDFVAMAPPEGGTPLDVKVKITATDARCYTPLVKWATVPFQADVDLMWSSGSGRIKVTGQVKQTMWGLASSRTFNRTIGMAIESLVAKQVNEFRHQDDKAKS